MTNSSNLRDAVADKLKFYLDVQRREEGFDMSSSNTYSNVSCHAASRGTSGPTLHFERLKDRSLKHYFTPQMIRTQIANLEAMSPGTKREREVKAKMKRSVRRTSFDDVVLTSPEIKSEAYKAQIRALRSLERDTSQRLYRRIDPSRMVRRTPPPRIQQKEVNRIIGRASQILVATETVALAQEILNQQHRSNSSRHRPKSAPSYMHVHQGRHASEATTLPHYGNNQPHRPSTAAGRFQGSNQSRSGRRKIRKPKYCWDLHGQRVRVVQNKTRKDDVSSSNRSSIDYERPLARPMSADIIYIPNPYMHMNSPVRRSGCSVDMATQTETEVVSKKESKKKSKKVQSAKIHDYIIKIWTGDKSGAGTRADVYIVLDGRRLKTEELFLTESMSHSRPFRRGQVDEFKIEAEDVGDLKYLGIGHDQKEKDFSWFIEKIEVRVGDKTWNIPCRRWFSGKAKDRRTFRFLKAFEARLESSSSESRPSSRGRSASLSSKESFRRRKQNEGKDRLSGHDKSATSRSSSQSKTSPAEKEKIVILEKEISVVEYSTDSSRHSHKVGGVTKKTAGSIVEVSDDSTTTASKQRSLSSSGSSESSTTEDDKPTHPFGGIIKQDQKENASSVDSSSSFDSDTEDNKITVKPVSTKVELPTVTISKASNDGDSSSDSDSSGTERDVEHDKKSKGLFSFLDKDKSESSKSESSGSSSSEDELELNKQLARILNNGEIENETMETSSYQLQQGSQGQDKSESGSSSHSDSSSSDDEEDPHPNDIPRNQGKRMSFASLIEEPSQKLSVVAPFKQELSTAEVREDDVAVFERAPITVKGEAEIHSSSISETSSESSTVISKVVSDDEFRDKVITPRSEFHSNDSPKIETRKRETLSGVEEDSDNDSNSGSSDDESSESSSASSSEEEDNAHRLASIPAAVTSTTESDARFVELNAIKTTATATAHPLEASATVHGNTDHPDLESALSSQGGSKHQSSSYAEEVAARQVEIGALNNKDNSDSTLSSNDESEPGLSSSSSSDEGRSHKEALVAENGTGGGIEPVAPAPAITAAGIHNRKEKKEHDKNIELNPFKSDGIKDNKSKKLSSSSSSSSSEEEETAEDILLRGSDIHQAVLDNDFERVRELVERIPHLKDEVNERDWAPLHVAAANGRLRIIKWLATQGVNLNSETMTGYTAMHIAAMNGHVDCMMVLKSLGVSIESRNVDGQTPLHLAAVSGQLNVVKWIILNGGDYMTLDHSERSVEDLAKQNHHRDVVEFVHAYSRKMKSLKGESKSSSSSSSSSSGSSSSSDSEAEDEVGPLESQAALHKRKEEMELEEKRKIYEDQRHKMLHRKSSFLEEIRMETEQELGVNSQ